MLNNVINNKFYEIVFAVTFAVTSKELDEDCQKYKYWYSEEQGMKAPDAKQLKWMLLNPEISDLMKQKLVSEILDESKRLENEKDILLQAGGLSSETYAEYVEKHAKPDRDRCLKSSRLGVIAVTILAVVFLFLLLAVWRPETSKTSQIVVSMLCIFVTPMLLACVQYAIDMWQKAIDATHNAERSWYEESGRKLQERIVQVEERKKWIDELCASIAVYRYNFVLDDEDISE